MTIGTRIRNLRRARDLTQEELAEALGLTAKAVSGWECDRTSPDISQIPALCHYFHISADELLGIREEERRRVRDDTFSAAQLLAQNGEHMAAVEAFSAALARYPDDFEIMCALNYSVLVCIAQGKYAPARAEEERTLCAKRNERILANCTDDRIRYPAVSALARYYAEEGDLARAREMLSRLPDMADARNFVLPTLYTGDEAIRYEQELLFDVLHYIRRRMMRNFTTTAGTPFYTSAEMAQRYEKVLCLLALFYEDGDYGFFHNDVQDAHLCLARWEAEKGHFSVALSHLRRAADSALAFLDYCTGGDVLHTSLLFRGLSDNGDTVSSNTEANNAREVLDAMAEPVFDALRVDASAASDFEAIRTRLLPRAGTWTETRDK